MRARPKGSALWNPAAFEKAGEAFNCATRFPILVHSALYIPNKARTGSYIRRLTVNQKFAKIVARVIIGVLVATMLLGLILPMLA